MQGIRTPELQWLESKIEKETGKYAKDVYGIQHRKFKSPEKNSVPDRLFFCPNGLLIIVEFKRFRQEPTPNQKREINRLLKLGHLVYVIDHFSLGKLLFDHYAARDWTPPPFRLPLLPVGGD